MARLIDTSLRLLAQAPLAGRVPIGKVLEAAALLDTAGFHALEVSGGGCFQAAIDAAIESPWERIRAVKRRAPRTPLAIALRGTFLAGTQPVDADVVRRFILCAADSGIDIFRLHDPLNDADDLRVPAEAVREAGGRLYAGLIYSQGPGGDDLLVERSRALASLGADRIILQDVSGQLDPSAVRPLVERLAAASGLPVGVFVQGPGGTAVAAAMEAARAGADPISAASYPVAVPGHRAAVEVLAPALAGLGLDPGIDLAVVNEAALLIDRELGADTSPPVTAHQSLLAAIHRVPAELVVAVERQLAAARQPDRLNEALEEVHRVVGEVGSPPTASPVGDLITRQAVGHVLTGRRWTTFDPDMRRLVLGQWGRTPGPPDAMVVAAAQAAPEPDPAEAEVSLDDARRRAGELAASDEDLCLIALFGDRALPLLEQLRGRATSHDDLGGAEPHEQQRVRGLVAILEETGATELTIEDGGTRITVRKDQPVAQPVYLPAAAAAAPVEEAPVDTLVRITSPMVGNFYRSAEPGQPAFVEVGDRVEVGQTLCVLEAMKLFNEFKSEYAGVLRRVVAEDSHPVEFGQLLFELDPEG